MLKNILNLKGAQQLSKEEQQSINGGGSCFVGCGSPFLGVGSICYKSPGCNDQGVCRENASTGYLFCYIGQ